MQDTGESTICGLFFYGLAPRLTILFLYPSTHKLISQCKQWPFVFTVKKTQCLCGKNPPKCSAKFTNLLLLQKNHATQTAHTELCHHPRTGN